MKRLIIYHGNCIDGFTAAWSMTKGFPDAELFAAHYGHEPPDVAGRDVWIVDFSYPRAPLEAMHVDAASLIVLDHHKTAEEDLRGLSYAEFDMERSGAGMSWDWCAAQMLVDAERPALVDYVEDRDLWRFALPESRAVNAYISTQPQTFARWDELAAMSANEMAEGGRAVLAYIDRYVEEMSKQAILCTFAGYPDVPCVNAPYIHTSELVGALAQDALFAVGWHQRADGRIAYSLRSKGSFDVSALAQLYGGGGHRNAAGFTLLALDSPAEVLRSATPIHTR